MKRGDAEAFVVPNPASFSWPEFMSDWGVLIADEVAWLDIDHPIRGDDSAEENYLRESAWRRLSGHLLEAGLSLQRGRALYEVYCDNGGWDDATLWGWAAYPFTDELAIVQFFGDDSFSGCVGFAKRAALEESMDIVVEAGIGDYAASRGTSADFRNLDSNSKTPAPGSTVGQPSRPTE